MSVKVLGCKQQIDLSRKGYQAAHRIAGKVRGQAQKTGQEQAQNKYSKDYSEIHTAELFTKTTSPGLWELPPSLQLCGSWMLLSLLLQQKESFPHLHESVSPNSKPGVGTCLPEFGSHAPALLQEKLGK